MPVTVQQLKSFLDSTNGLSMNETEALKAPFAAVEGKKLYVLRSYSTMYIQYKSSPDTFAENTICISYHRGRDSSIHISMSNTWNNKHTYCRPLAVTADDDDESPLHLIVRGVKQFLEGFQKPESRGSVKAYCDGSREYWVWKRPSSPNISKAGDDYFFTKTDPRFREVWVSETDRELRLLSGEDTVPIGGRIYLRSILIPLYVNALPFTEFHSYILPSKASQYNFVMVDGEKRYVNLRRTSSALHDTPIHSYSTRIEGLVSVDDMFLKGKMDLYAKRDNAETPFLGWELEAQCHGVDTATSASHIKLLMDKLVMCKSDSSIGGSGFETVSVPATLDFWKESNLSQTLDTMRLPPYTMRSFESSKCGFHVHVSRSALSVLDLQKIERFVHNPDNRYFMVTVANRSANTYQNYNDNLFKNRKSLVPSELSSVGETLVGNIGFFYGLDAFMQRAREYATNAINNELRFNYFGTLVEEHIHYASLDREFRTRATSELLYEYSNLCSPYGTGNWSANLGYSLMSRGNSAYVGFSRVTNENLEAYHERLIKVVKMLYGAVAENCPPLQEALHLFFPEHFPPVVEAEEESRRSTTGIGGLRKSALSSKRRDSYSASQGVKGPVGKAVSGRYDVLNTRNVNTVEFRLFKGTMNPTTVMRYLEFVDAIVRFVAQTSATNDGLHYKAFTSWLVGDGFNISRYEHLISFCTSKNFIDRKSIRRKTLPTVDIDDTKCEGLVAIKPKVSEAVVEPIGTFTSNANAVAVNPVAANMMVVDYDPDYEYIEPEASDPDEYMEDDRDGCGDPDCDMCN